MRGAENIPIFPGSVAHGGKKIRTLRIFAIFSIIHRKINNNIFQIFGNEGRRVSPAGMAVAL